MAKLTFYGTDLTGLWSKYTENGWGINLIQQGPTIFATMFIYGTDNKPTWLVASGLVPTGSLTWSGALYQTSGPSYTGAFNPSLVNSVQVGTMTLTASSASAIRLVYTVNRVHLHEEHRSNYLDRQ